MSIRVTGDTDEPHNILSWKRIFTNVTLLAMLGFGFMYQQSAKIVEAKPLRFSQSASFEQRAKASALKKELVATKPDEKAKTEQEEKDEIAKFISACRSSLDKDDVATIANIIQKESKKRDYDWKLILAIVKTESHFDPRARSSKGARGLMQVLPSTAKWLSPKMGLKYRGRDSLYEPEYNVKLGMHYLNMLHQQYGDMDKAIAAYNRGPSGLARYLRQGKKFPPKYLVQVMDHYKELKDNSDQLAS